MSERNSTDSKQPFSFEQDGLGDVLEAVRDKRHVAPPSIYAHRLLTFVSKHGVPSDFEHQFREFQTYMRARFGIRLVVLGGGVGCEKFVCGFEGAKTDVELALDRLRQMEPALYSRLRRMHLDYATDEKTKATIFVEKPGLLERSAAGTEISPPGLDSIDSLIQSIDRARLSLERALAPQPGGTSLYRDYIHSLKAVLDSLLKPGLIDDSAWTELKIIGQTIFRIPEAAGPSERILGALTRIAMQRVIKAAGTESTKG